MNVEEIAVLVLTKYQSAIFSVILVTQNSLKEETSSEVNNTLESKKVWLLLLTGTLAD
jgi:hypothetical protein